MKSLIKNALDSAMSKVDKAIPQTKKQTKSLSIDGVMPINLAKFMKDNNVPDDAYLDGSDNGYDGWIPQDIKLSWEIDVPTTDNDKLLFRMKRFNASSFKFVYDALISSGYNRIGSKHGLYDKRFMYEEALRMPLKHFDDTTVYYMYKAGNFDRLVKYYSLFFNKNQK